MSFGQLAHALGDYANAQAAQAAFAAANANGVLGFYGTTTTQIFDGGGFTSQGNGAINPSFNPTTNTIIIPAQADAPTNSVQNAFISEAPSNSVVNLVDNGFDLIVAGNQTSGVQINVTNLAAPGASIDTIVGGSVADSFSMTGRGLILAGSGHETVWLNSADDTIYGGGNTNATSNVSHMTYFGESGVNSATSHDTVNGSTFGGDTVQFFAGDNSYYGHATTGSDTIYTGAGKDLVDLGGSSGNDSVWGTQQASFGSTIYGGSGHDNIQVFTGNNDIFGATTGGMDTVYLGAGSDSFAGRTGADKVHIGTTATNITQTIVGGTSTNVFTDDTATVGSTDHRRLYAGHPGQRPDRRSQERHDPLQRWLREYHLIAVTSQMHAARFFARRFSLTVGVKEGLSFGRESVMPFWVERPRAPTGMAECRSFLFTTTFPHSSAISRPCSRRIPPIGWRRSERRPRGISPASNCIATRCRRSTCRRRIPSPGASTSSAGARPRCCSCSPGCGNRDLSPTW